MGHFDDNTGHQKLVPVDLMQNHLYSITKNLNKVTFSRKISYDVAELFHFKTICISCVLI